jgi:DNA-binding response OmpR family regulator
MRILLIDDSRTMRNIQRRVLCSVPQVRCAEADDGPDALSQVAGDPRGFDLFLVDWNMPGTDSVSLVRRLRDIAGAVPVLMAVTAAEQAEAVAASREGGFQVVVKPFTTEGLIEAVRRTVGGTGNTAQAA